MLFTWNIEDIMNGILKENDIKDVYVIEGNCSLMSYVPSKKIIKYNKDNINKNLILYPYINKDKFIELATYHELGHYYTNTDQHINESNRLEKELQAWKTGRKLIKYKTDKEYFDIINKQNILRYINNDKRIFLLMRKYINWIKINSESNIEEIKENRLTKIINYRKNSFNKINKAEFVEIIKCNLEKDICFEMTYNSVTESYLLLIADADEKYIVEIGYYSEHNKPNKIYKII